jgi:GT2 family glycosyltransferase
LYNSDPEILDATLKSLLRSVAALKAGKASESSAEVMLDVIDNSTIAVRHKIICDAEMPVKVVSGHGNIGFGAGHNLSIRQVESDYHLILNPDVILADNALSVALAFMQANPQVVLLSPESREPSTGKLQFQTKTRPGWWVLALRMLDFPLLNRLFSSRLHQYEERARTLAGQTFDAQIVSGCFMLFRTDALKNLNGFDERYFLYFEDFDLSLRAQKLGRVVYNPDVKIVHFGGGAGRKGWRHIRMFLRSAVTFFNHYGWKWI